MPAPCNNEIRMSASRMQSGPVTKAGRRLAALAALTVAVVSGSVWAQEKAVDAPAPLNPVQTLIAWERASLESFLADPRDAKLLAALKLFPQRITELPEEVTGPLDANTAKVINLALKAISHPSRLAVFYDPQSNSGGAFGYGIAASTVFSNAEDSAELSEVVETVVTAEGQGLPKASKTYAGMRMTSVPGGKLSFGRFQKGNTYDVFFGTLAEDPWKSVGTLPALTVDGLTPLVHGSFDFKALTPLANLMQMGISQASNANGARPPDLLKEFTSMNLVGENAINGSFEIGHTKDGLRGRVRVKNVKQTLSGVGFGSSRLTAKDINIIPSDATSAAIAVVTTDALVRIVSEISNQAKAVSEMNADVPADPFGQFTQITGVDLQKDVLATLGGVGGMYASESTGGGGFSSYVAFIELRDRATFLSSHTKLVKTAAQFLQGQATDVAKYIRLRAWKLDGVELFTLTPAGLPVPFEFTYSVGERFLIAGLTPQAVIAAAKQATGKGDKGLLSRSDLRLLDPANQELLSISFSDTLRRARKGYGLISLVGSAISNAVRAPMDRTGEDLATAEPREPGLIVPLYNDLMKGVRPSISVSYRQGDDLIMDSVQDGSVLVGAAAFAGTVYDFAPSIGMAAAGAANQVQQRGLMGSLIDQGIDTLNLPLNGFNFPSVSVEGLRAARSVLGLLHGPLATFSPEYLAVSAALAAAEIQSLTLTR